MVDRMGRPGMQGGNVPCPGDLLAYDGTLCLFLAWPGDRRSGFYVLWMSNGVVQRVGRAYLKLFELLSRCDGDG